MNDETRRRRYLSEGEHKTIIEANILYYLLDLLESGDMFLSTRELVVSE